MPSKVLLWAWIAALLLAGIATGATPETPEQQLVAWVQKSGGEVNVHVQHIHGTRGTVAVKDLPQGSTLAAIPEALVYVACKEPDDDFMEAAAQLMQEMNNTSSSWAPYWAAMPTASQLISPYSLPDKYLPMLQSGVQEAYMVDQRAELLKYWQSNAAPHPALGKTSLEDSGWTLENLEHSAGLMATRAVSTPLGPHSLVPVLDMANHVNLCANTYSLQPCPQDPQQRCILWVAGRDYKQGEEVCNSYGGMFNDRALLQYGFLLPSGPQPPDVYGMDRHDFDVADVWGNQLFTDTAPAPFTADSGPGYQEELQRQRTMLFYLKLADEDAAKEEPDVSDPNGRVLALVRQWRQLRKAALAAEVQRLRGILSDVGEALLSEAEYEQRLQQQLDREAEVLQQWGTMGERYINPDAYDSSYDQDTDSTAGSGQEGGQEAAADWQDSGLPPLPVEQGIPQSSGTAATEEHSADAETNAEL